MSLASYSPVSKEKQYACVEVNLASLISGAWTPSGSGVQATFINSLAEAFVVTVQPSAGGVITPSGASFILTGPSNNYGVTVTFDRKYSGSISFIGTNWDNNPGSGIDKICSPSIGFPDTLQSGLENVGGCIQVALNSAPATPRVMTWSEVNEITSFTFTFTRTNPASSLTIDLNLFEKSIQRWERKDIGNTIIWFNPLTASTYTPSLPIGVKEIACIEDDRVVFYTKELCYGINSPICFNMLASPAIPLDAYNGINPRTDGIPSLTYTAPGAGVYEFSPNGDRLYNISGGALRTNFYNAALIQTNLTINPLNFLNFPAAAGYAVVGLAAHPNSGVLHVLYMDPGPRRLYLAKIVNNVVNYIGDTQYNASIAPVFDGNDIVFTNSGQLLYGHGQNLYFVDSVTGVINLSTPIIIVPLSTNSFGIRQLSRYHNGDIHIAAQDSVNGPYVTIIDGESYKTLANYSSLNSITPPLSSLTIAFPQSPKVKFRRLYIKNLETQGESTEDRDLITNALLTMPNNAVIGECLDETPMHTSWTETVCYTVDKNVISQGILEISNTGQLVSTGPCTTIGGFVPPVPLVYSSVTHDLSGNNLFALNSAANQVQIYDWTTKATPIAGVLLNLTGYVGGAETEKSIRTRWTDNTLWMLTEEVVAGNRLYRFYIINKTSGILTLQGTAIYPARGFNNGHFAWGVDDELYFSCNIGAGAYGIHKLSKINFDIQYLVSSHTYTIDNLNIDLPNQRFIVTRFGNGLEFYSYSGQFITNCGIGVSNFVDAIHAPFGSFSVGTVSYKVKRVFIKDLVTLETNSYYQDAITGVDIQLPLLARLVSCDTSTVYTSKPAPRFRLLTGIVTWQKSINAPNAKSVTISRLANNITINDGLNGPFNINTAFSTTWSAEGGLGDDIIVSGTAAGSSFAITWIE